MREKIFLKVRSRLALWYAGVMGGILCLSGIGSYLVMAHAHWQSLDRELASVAGTLHDILEPNLNTPNQLSPQSKQILPNLCMVGTVCDRSVSQQHILGGVHQEGYYLRLISLSGKLLATIKEPVDDSLTISTENWQTVVDRKGERYHQVSLLLKTAGGQNWGYIQVGRSLNDYDRHLGESKLALFLGIPIALSFISLASWWLSAKAMRPVHKSYQQIQQFTADAAHELRTPISTIQATTESVLRQNILSETEARDTLKTIDRQNQRLSQLVKDLLLLSRMDLQIIPLQSCCLNDILNDLLEELAPLALSQAIALKSDIPAAPIHITGNEEQLYRLFTNLIVNGIRYTLEGGQVKVTLSHNDRNAIIEVQDTGIGIAQEEREKIFERFYRISSDRSRTTGGSGLGLAIAKAIVLSHKGSITVNSKSGKGSNFIVLLSFN